MLAHDHPCLHQQVPHRRPRLGAPCRGQRPSAAAAAPGGRGGRTQRRLPMPRCHASRAPLLHSPLPLHCRIVSLARRLWLMEQNALLVASATRRVAAIYRTSTEKAECLVRVADAQGAFLPRPVACVALRLVLNVKGVPSLEADDKRALVLLLRAVAGERECGAGWGGVAATHSNWHSRGMPNLTRERAKLHGMHLLLGAHRPRRGS